ncbi:MAG TPA: SdrD B-like domain-containing protein [Pirellulales bacterium]|nr:SdrD B-like domain-containing protein [Pirellulales bacterium]
MTGRRGRPLGVEWLEHRSLLTSNPIVTVDTNLGNFQIELRPDVAPQTVANFLSYVTSGAYTDTIFHRSEQPSASIPNDIGIIQTGGFTSASTAYTSVSQFQTIPTNAAIPLEYNLPNAIGTVAMARLSGSNTATATDQFFINDLDNSTNLGQSNGGGYAVFGQILGNGMQVVQQIAALSTIKADSTNTNSPFNQLPLGSNNQLARINSITLDSIDGTVFSDTNGNGQLDSGEQGVAGRTMFVDLHNTGTFQTGDPTATTDSSGNYSFSGIAAGTYKVYEELPTNISLTMPSQTVTVAANQTASGINFAEQISISGTVFNDTNGDGAISSGEAAIAGQTVFLNIDNTGAPDANNPSTITDSNGKYSFSDLPAGTYKVAVLSPAGTTITTSNPSVVIPAGGAVKTLNIGEQPPSIVGTVFTDANNNGKFDTGDVGVAGRVVFINKDNSGTADGTNPQTTTNSVGQFFFSRLTAGTYTVMEVLPTGGSLTTATQTITVTAGKTSTGVVFGELPSITGTVFVDLNKNGQADTGEPRLGGQTVFLNIDNTGAPDANNPSTTTDSNGNFAFGTEPPGSYKVMVQLPNNVTLSSSTPTVTVSTGHTAGVLLGELPSITGKVFTDVGKTGVYQSGDAGVAGRTVFLNIDGSGAPDNSNPSTTTDSSGNYYFLGLAPASYKVTEVAPTGITLTTSTQTVTVTAGELTSGVNIGESGTATGTASISGTVFNDLDLSGSFSSSDPGLAGRTVFLNIDGSGVPNSNNPSATTDANGVFTFSNLPAGTYAIEEVIAPFGSASPTTKPPTVSLTDGQHLSGVMIGNVVTSTVVPLTVSLKQPAATTDPNTAYINAVYQSILGHAPDATGLAFWQQQMSGGASRSTVAQGIWGSAEHRGEQVSQFYEEFLGRAPDAAGKQFWINAYQSWGTEQLETVGFLTATPEFGNLHSGNTNFVDALYNILNARSADAAGAAYWEAQLSAGVTPVATTTSFVFGQEVNRALIDAFYSDFLHRAPDSASLQTYLNDLATHSMSADQIAVQLLSSDEYFKRVANLAPTITSAAAASFTHGTAGSFTITTTGGPTPTITESGSLPNGLTFVDNGDGTATLSGTPASGTAGTYPLSIRANNGVGVAATQQFSLTIS